MALRLERVDGLNYAWTTETPVLLNSERYRDFFVEWKSPPLAADQWVGSHFPETRFLASSLKCSLILCLVSQKVLAESTQIESTILCHLLCVYNLYICSDPSGWHIKGAQDARFRPAAFFSQKFACFQGGPPKNIWNLYHKHSTDQLFSNSSHQSLWTLVDSVYWFFAHIRYFSIDLYKISIWY